MSKKVAPLFLFGLFLDCHDDGVQVVSIPSLLGPAAVTDRTVYGINEPITVTISSDTSTISIYDCGDGLAFYLELAQGQVWDEWEDNATPCLESQFPRIHTISPGNAYTPTVVPRTLYPGLYRLRIPYYAMSRFDGEIVSNLFELKE